MPNVAETIENETRQAWSAGDHQRVARLVLSGYGDELYGFLLAQFRGRDADADEAFLQFSEDFWRGLPRFQWRCSIRAWCYKLARSAASRYRRAPQNRVDRRIPLSQADHPLADLVHQTRTRTQLHQQTEVKNHVRELRERLSQDEQDLLTLRIDRELSWRDVAHAMSSPDDNLDDDDLRRRETALRQRLADVKKRLRKLAISSGVLAD
jgi:RNA polymerase sigma-70 factor, ECF subfamily